MERVGDGTEIIEEGIEADAASYNRSVLLFLACCNFFFHLKRFENFERGAVVVAVVGDMRTVPKLIIRGQGV